MDLLECGICHGGLKDPRTLPCLHSFCLECLTLHRQSAINAQSEWKCALCRHPVALGSGKKVEDLPCDPFIRSLVESAAALPLDPNNVLCELCDDGEGAVVHCLQCNQFCCDRCQKSHKKSKIAANHQLTSLDEYFSSTQGTGAASSAKARTSHCTEHPQQIIDSFCRTCMVSVCPSCAVKNHSGHIFCPIDRVLPEFIKGIQDTFPPAAEKEGKLKQSISRIGGEISEVERQAERAKVALNRKIDEMIVEIETRRVQLLEEIEEKRQRKAKQLQAQKDELEMVQVGLETCLVFGRKLVEEGNGIEISLSRDYFLTRMEHLRSTRVQLESVCAPLLAFEASSYPQFHSSVAGFGSILDQDISPKHSFISSIDLVNPPASTRNHFTGNSLVSSAQIGQEVIRIHEKETIRIGIVCCDAKGNPFDRRVGAAGQFEVQVNPPQGKVLVEEDKEGKGKFWISVEGGQTEGKFGISIKLRGEGIAPQLLQCEILRVSGEKSFAIINGNEIHATPATPVLFAPATPFTFQVVSVDQVGNALTKGGATFDASIEPPVQGASAEILDLRNGKYEVKVRAEREGKVNLAIRLRGQRNQIKAFPITFDTSVLPPFGQDWFGGNKRFEVLYDAKRDGFSNQTFHQKCDNRGPTVTLVRLKNGSIFGGYASAHWESTQIFTSKQAPGSFLFSLSDGKGRQPLKMDEIIHPQNAMLCNANYGPVFGGGIDADLFLNLSDLPSSYSALGNTYKCPHEYRSNEAMNFLAGSYDGWDFENVQVFSVI